MRKKEKNKDGPVFSFVKMIFRFVKKKPEIINLNNEMNDKAIFVANHSGASGPFTYELYFPKKVVPWGTHEMTGKYGERWKYLYYTFYRRKLGYGKVRSFIIATLFAVISRTLYKAVGLIPTFTDNRLIKTIRQSLNVFNDNKAVIIFPENSSEGYKEILEEYFPGFVALSKIFFDKTGQDLPVYNIYYSKKHNKLAIDKPLYIQDSVKQELSNSEIANLFRDNANSLYKELILSDEAFVRPA